MRAKGNTRSPVLAACRAGTLLPLRSPGTGLVLQNSPPQPRNETSQRWTAIEWATYRCQTNHTRQTEGRKAAVVPGGENKPAMTIKASGQQTGAAAQDLNPLHTKSKAETRSGLQQNGLFPSIWKSFKQLWGGRKLSQPVTRQSKTDQKTRSPLKQKRHQVFDNARRAGVVLAGHAQQAPAAKRCLRKILLQDIWRDLPTQKTPKKPTQL